MHVVHQLHMLCMWQISSMIVTSVDLFMTTSSIDLHCHCDKRRRKWNFSWGQRSPSFPFLSPCFKRPFLVWDLDVDLGPALNSAAKRLGRIAQICTQCTYWWGGPSQHDHESLLCAHHIFVLMPQLSIHSMYSIAWILIYVIWQKECRAVFNTTKR